MKRLTIDQTWEQCLAMWKWISRQCLGKDRSWCPDNIERLKREWLEKNGFGTLDHLCFFCEYRVLSTPANCGISVCNYCPGRKVDMSFSCTNIDHSYESRPRLFYTELKRLNKIRLAKK